MYLVYRAYYGGGDYIEFEVCTSCGRVQDFIALSPDHITESFSEA